MLRLFDGLLCDVENGPLTGRATLQIRRRIHVNLMPGGAPTGVEAPTVSEVRM